MRYPKRDRGGFYPFAHFHTYIGYRPPRGIRMPNVFSPLQYLLWRPEREEMTESFRRLVLPLLSQISGDEMRHQYVHVVTKEKPFPIFAGLLNKPDAQCDPRLLIHMLEEQVNARRRLYIRGEHEYFSKQYPNYARVAPNIWVVIVWNPDKKLLKKEKDFGVWTLHAFSMAEPETAERNKDKVLKPGFRLISGRSCA